MPSSEMRNPPSKKWILVCVGIVLLTGLKYYGFLSTVTQISHSGVPAFLDTRANRWNVTDTSNQFYLITMLSLYCEHVWPGYEKFTVKDLNERDAEYLTTLQSNINHPLVKEVHLFYTDEEALTVVKQQKLKNRYKIIPVKTERRVHMMDFFHYTSTHLLDKPVIALNGDIVVGEGFDKVDTVKMRDNRVLYSLTRHGHTEGNCTVENYCLDRKYMGSHDAHIFRLSKPLDEDLLLRLDYPINMWQAENGMIGAFLYLFNFKVYNPCSILRTYHRHCSPVHKQGKHYSIKDAPYKWSPQLLGRAEFVKELLYE